MTKESNRLSDSDESSLVNPGGAKVIAVVDDEPDIVELITINLSRAGFKVKGFFDAGSFFKYLKFDTPDLVLLDLMLPDADGLEVCKILKKDDKYASVYVIMLTAKSEEMDKILGLELGADDYITKPFSIRELTARVKAMLRRDSQSHKTHRIKIGELLELDLQTYRVLSDGMRIDLTSTEFKILKLLSERIGWVYSREQILDYLGSNDKGVLDRTVDVHIKNLREKLGKAGKYIKNIRGIGYKLEELL
ncbi:MAG: two-component system, OmpR family, alkaline phosphatase synthesis response regulator PhoP [Bacteroidota bacterium]|nr:two-component system, OmpR family, alkaline phosphatase synthesis response regulator PhoP [Bacteroidota bacterium]